MPRSTDTRPRMEKTAAQLLRRQGYAATSWRQVVAESGTPWGSQAHFFPEGKQQLAGAALRRSGASYERLLRAVLADGHPADAIRTWAQAAAGQLEASGWADGCPIATVALETAHESDELQGACADAFVSWRAVLAEAFVAHGATESDARKLAVLVLAAIEGALLLARTDRDPEPLVTVGDELAALLHARLRGTPSS